MTEPAVHAEVCIDLISDRYARLALRAAVRAVAKGEPVYLTDRGKQVGEIVPPGEAARLRRFAEVNAGLRRRLAELGQEAAVKVRFCRSDGSTILADYDLPAVPAHGDAVYLNGASWVVRDRAWDLEGRDETVIVGLQTRDEYQQERDRRLEPLRRLQERKP